MASVKTIALPPEPFLRSGQMRFGGDGNIPTPCTDHALPRFRRPGWPRKGPAARSRSWSRERIPRHRPVAPRRVVTSWRQKQAPKAESKRQRCSGPQCAPFHARSCVPLFLGINPDRDSFVPELGAFEHQRSRMKAIPGPWYHPKGAPGPFARWTIHWAPCELVHTAPHSFVAGCFAEGGDMDEPTKLVPDWLTIDLLIIALGLTTILIGVWIV
jgi:hypothetical protein